MKLVIVYLESANKAAPEMMDSRLSSKAFLFLASLYVKGLMIREASKSSRAAASSPAKKLIIVMKKLRNFVRLNFKV